MLKPLCAVFPFVFPRVFFGSNLVELVEISRVYIVNVFLQGGFVTVSPWILGLLLRHSKNMCLI